MSLPVAHIIKLNPLKLSCNALHYLSPDCLSGLISLFHPCSTHQSSFMTGHFLKLPFSLPAFVQLLMLLTLLTSLLFCLMKQFYSFIRTQIKYHLHFFVCLVSFSFDMLSYYCSSYLTILQQIAYLTSLIAHGLQDSRVLSTVVKPKLNILKLIKVYQLIISRTEIL